MSDETPTDETTEPVHTVLAPHDGLKADLTTTKDRAQSLLAAWEQVEAQGQHSLGQPRPSGLKVSYGSVVRTPDLLQASSVYFLSFLFTVLTAWASFTISELVFDEEVTLTITATVTALAIMAGMMAVSEFAPKRQKWSWRGENSVLGGMIRTYESLEANNSEEAKALLDPMMGLIWEWLELRRLNGDVQIAGSELDNMIQTREPVLTETARAFAETADALNAYKALGLND